MNMFMACGAGPWNALVDVERAAYDAAKAAGAAVAFPSLQLEFLYGKAGDCVSADDTCFDVNYAKLASLKRDRFAVTTFPYLLQALRDPAAIRDDWFTRPGDRGGERTVIAETGWLGAPLVVTLGAQCITGIPSSQTEQLTWFNKVLAAAERGKMDLVTWVSNRDVLPAGLMSSCPCTYDVAWCALISAIRQSAGAAPDAQAGAEYAIKQFGAMGLRQYDGTPRLAFMARWEAVRELPWAGKP
jgi:hypothetical protein